MKVVADADALVWTERAGLHLRVLPALFHPIMVAEAVAEEILNGPTGGWMAKDVRPGAYQVEQVTAADRRRVRFTMHAGERDTLALALRERVPIIYGDDRSILANAPKEGIRVFTFGALLGLAERNGLLSAETTIASMAHWLSPERQALFLQRAREVL